MSSEVGSIQSQVDAWLDAATRNSAMPAVSCKTSGVVKLSYQATGSDKVTLSISAPAADVAACIVDAAKRGLISGKPLSNASYFLRHDGGVPDSVFAEVSKRTSSGSTSSSTASGEKTTRTPRTSSGKTGDKVPKDLAVARADVDKCAQNIDRIVREYDTLPMLRDTLAALTLTRDNLEKQYADKQAADKAEKERAEKERAEKDAAKLAKEAATEAKAIAAAEKAQKQAEKLLAKVAALKARVEELKAKGKPADAIPVADAAGQPVIGQTV